MRANTTYDVTVVAVGTEGHSELTDITVVAVGTEGHSELSDNTSDVTLGDHSGKGETPSSSGQRPSPASSLISVIESPLPRLQSLS